MTGDQFYGWTREQWAVAADYVLARGEVLPPECDLSAALEVMDTWLTYRNEATPGPSVILRCDILGRELPPQGPRLAADQWARLMFGFARKEERQAWVSRGVKAKA